MFYKLLPLILFCAILCLLLFLEKKSWYGLFLNKRIKPFYTRLKYNLSELNGSQIVDDITKSAINHLKSLFSIYKKPPVNDLYDLSRDIFDNFNDYNITNAWSIFYIDTYIKNSHNNMVNKLYLKNKLDELEKSNYYKIPQTILYHFNIKKEQD